MGTSLIDEIASTPLSTSTVTGGDLSLSWLLKTSTAPLHRQVEALLKLPGAIRNVNDYCRLLGLFLGLYEPLEHRMAGFPQWNELDLSAPSRSQVRALTQDLLALGIDPTGLPRAPTALLPDLANFAQALGAFYVLEGATLGGLLILRDLQARIGIEIAGATRFFGGRGKALGPMWQQARAALDRYGQQHEPQSADVVTGAECTFQSMLAWFTAHPAPVAAEL